MARPIPCLVPVTIAICVEFGNGSIACMSDNSYFEIKNSILHWLLCTKGSAPTNGGHNECVQGVVPVSVSDTGHKLSTLGLLPSRGVHSKTVPSGHIQQHIDWMDWLNISRERRAWNSHQTRRIYVEIQEVSLRFAQSRRRLAPDHFRIIELTHSRRAPSQGLLHCSRALASPRECNFRALRTSDVPAAQGLA